MDQASASKLTDTQSIIRNKFAQAYTNRFEHERDVVQINGNYLTTSERSAHVARRNNITTNYNHF